MKNIKKIVTMVMAGVLITSLVGCNMIEKTPAAKAKVVLAEVNGEKITRGDLDASMKTTLNMLVEKYGEDFEENVDIKAELKSTREDELEFLVLRKLLMQYGKDNNLLMTDEDANKKADEQIEYLKTLAGSEEAYNKELEEYYGMTQEEYKVFAKEMVIIGDINTKIQTSIKEAVTVTDEELKAYYDKNVATFTVKAGADTYNILLKTEKEAKEVRAKISTLDQFKAQADIYNTDSTKGKGGYLGWLEYENSNTVEEFDAVFKTLKNGEISQPVKSKFGYHLITVANTSAEDKVKTYDESKESIKETLVSNIVAEKYNEKIEEIKKEYNVKVNTNKF